MNERDLLERLIEEAGRRGYIKHQLEDAMAELRTAGEAMGDIDKRMKAIETEHAVIIRESANKDSLIKIAGTELRAANDARSEERATMQELAQATLPFFQARKKVTRQQRTALMNARGAAIKLLDSADEPIPF